MTINNDTIAFEAGDFTGLSESAKTALAAYINGGVPIEQYFSNLLNADLKVALDAQRARDKEKIIPLLEAIKNSEELKPKLEALLAHASNLVMQEPAK